MPTVYTLLKALANDMAWQHLLKISKNSTPLTSEYLHRLATADIKCSTRDHSSISLIGFFQWSVIYNVDFRSTPVFYIHNPVQVMLSCTLCESCHMVTMLTHKSSIATIT